MKIAISGTANSGKTTLLKDFLNTWPNYVTPTKTYRDLLKERNLGHSDKTSEETQQLILDFMINQLEENKDQTHIIYDRCPIDCLVYTVQASEDGLVSDDFVTDMILKIRNSLHLLDVIFVLPYDERIPIQNNGVRNTDVEYIKRIDSIFQSLVHQYFTDFEANIFFPVENCPGIVPLEASNKLLQIKGILNKDGDLYSPEDDIQAQKDLAKAISDAKKSKKLLEALIESQGELSKETQPKKELIL
jgi:predicted ATPase